MDMSEITARLVTYFNDELGVPIEVLEADKPLFSSRELNSLDILRVVSFIEESFGISVGTWEVSQEGFDTVSKIAAFIYDRTNG